MDRTHPLTHHLGRLEGAGRLATLFTAVQKVGGIAPVERFGQVGRKVDLAAARGGAGQAPGVEQAVEGLAVGGDDVENVGPVLGLTYPNCATRWRFRCTECFSRACLAIRSVL